MSNYSPPTPGRHQTLVPSHNLSPQNDYFQSWGVFFLPQNADEKKNKEQKTEKNVQIDIYCLDNLRL